MTLRALYCAIILTAVGQNLRMNVTLNVSDDPSDDTEAVEVPATRQGSCEQNPIWEEAAASFNAAIDRAVCNAEAGGKYWKIPAIYPGKRCMPVYCAERQDYCCPGRNCDTSVMDIARALLIFGAETFLSGLQYSLCD